MPHDIFISYSRRDLADVMPIKERLESEGFSCWMDLNRISSDDEDFVATIVPAIRGARAAFLFFLSRESQTSDYAMKEIRFATARGKRVVIVRFNDDPLTDEFLFRFQDRNIRDWRNPDQRAALLRDLAEWTEKGATVSEEEDSGRSSLFLQDSVMVRSGLRKLEASEAEQRSGFRVERFGDDAILVSDDVDAALRAAAPDAIRAETLPDGNPFAAAMEAAARDPVRERIRAWWKRIRGDDFKNESKIGLASDLLLDNGTLPASLSVFRTDYFSSYRTNELATKLVEEEEDGESGPIWEGADHFPWKTDASGRRTMQPFSESGFSNHLGGNTLGVTDDGMLVLWLQSGKAERSQGCWAPTGSGSLDWNDLDAGGSFLKTIANGAEREMKEEGLIRAGVKPETKVLGFYRWCSRGGLPGFLCVSRIGCGAADLSPNKSEVCTPKGRPLSPLHAARTPGELQRSVDLLLEEGALPGGHPLSIPLLANLHAVRKALAAGDSRLDFLFGR